VATSHKLYKRKSNFAQITEMKTKIHTNYKNKNLSIRTNYKRIFFKETKTLIRQSYRDEKHLLIYPIVNYNRSNIV
jgi:hypothetical protein